jgi:hypothetical protein
MATTAVRDPVEAAVNYIDRIAGKPSIFMSDAAPGDAEGTARHTGHRVTIHDARRISGGAGIDRQGFTLQRSKTAIADFHDKD